MSKHRKRGRTKQNSRYVSVNLHHLLWPKADWNKGYAKLLRSHPYMKYIMNKWNHEQIHQEMIAIHPPSGQLCKQAFELICGLDAEGSLNYYDHLEKRIDLLLSIWKYSDCQRTKEDLLHQKEIIKHLYGRS